MNTVKGSIKSRRVAVPLAPGLDGAAFEALMAALEAGGAHPDVISLALGIVNALDGTPVPVDKTTQVAASVLYDGMFVPDGAEHIAALSELSEVEQFVREMCRHGKAIGVSGDAAQLLPPGVEGPGVIVESGDKSAVEAFVRALGEHRFPQREGTRGGIGGLSMPTP